MGFFGKRKGDVLDLTEGFQNKPVVFKKEEYASIPEKTEESKPETTSAFGFFSNFNSKPAETSVTPTETSTEIPEDKKRRLAKRLMDMTDKIEELSNQIYHLQQRIEVLEKKNEVGNFGNVFN